MDTIKKILQDSIGTGELLNIIYNGGSEPGAARMILPLQIEGDKVRAKCYTTNKAKLFNIDKIEIAPSDASNYSGFHVEPPSLQDAVAPYWEELKELGWEIETTDDSVCLFSYFKNGKRRKSPSVGICYFLTDSSDAINPRPWHAGGKSWKYLSKAVIQFMVAAREINKWSPIKSNPE